jgi:hypothetical protein
MAFVIKGRSSIFLKDEVTENTYVAPASAADAIEVLEDFSGFEYTRESIERSVLSNTVESEAPRVGLPDISGSLPTEFKSAATEGAAPRATVLWKSLLGAKRNASAAEVDTGSTTTVINLVDASGINPGDILLFKKAGEYAVRPVASKASNAVTLAFALPYSPAAGVDVAAFTTYYHDTFDGSFSVSAELGGEITEKATGCKVESGEIGNWSTGQIPTVAFGIKALGMDKVDSVSGISTDFSAEPQPPVALDAKAYIDGVAVDYAEFGLNINNTLTDILSAARAQGKAGSRLTNLLVTGSINPYMSDSGVARFTKFNNSTSMSLFVYVANPSETAGEFSNVAAVWLPQVTITSLTNGDEDGVLTDEIEFQAAKSEGNDTVFLGFI